MQFIKSNKASKLLVNKGFLYSRGINHRKMKKQCGNVWEAKIISVVRGSTQIVKSQVLNEHSHAPDPSKISGKQFFSKLKQLSMSLGSPTHAVIAKVCQTQYIIINIPKIIISSLLKLQ